MIDNFEPKGIAGEQDKLPAKFFDRPLKGGPTEGVKVDKTQLDIAIFDRFFDAR